MKEKPGATLIQADIFPFMSSEAQYSSRDSPFNQYCGSITFWCESGSADPCLWLMDPDWDPAIFVIDLQHANKKLIFWNSFSAYYFLKVHLHHFSTKKGHKKKSQNSRNQGFSYYFCLMIEGSGSIPVTNGSAPGFMRPKSIRIRIHDAAFSSAATRITLVVPDGVLPADWRAVPAGEQGTDLSDPDPQHCL